MLRQFECPRADFTASAPIIASVNHPLESGQRGRLLRVLSVVVIAVVSVVLIAWFLGGNTIVEKAIHNRTQPWAVFQVPETAANGLGGLADR